MIARELLVALPVILLVALVGCGGIRRWVASEPRPGRVLYVGGLDMPDRPDVADPRREHDTWPATAGAIAHQTHAYIEFSGKMAFGPGTVVHAVAGYLTWF